MKSTVSKTALQLRARATRIAIGLLCLGLALSAGQDEARAHAKSLSYSSWTLDEAGGRVRVRLPRLELTRLNLDSGTRADAARLLPQYLADHLKLWQDGVECPGAGLPESRSAPEGWVVYSWRVECSARQGEREIRSSILLEAAPSHLHFARARFEFDGGETTRVLERVLSEESPAWALGSARAENATGRGDRVDAGGIGATLGSYVSLGIEHILGGWDHLAFLFALLLLAVSLREVAWLVTAFTIAHSITLGLAVLGWLRPEALAVEAVIGFSVALVALENAWLTGGRNRWIPRLIVGGLVGLAATTGLGHSVLSPLTLLGLALFAGAHFRLLDRAPSSGPLRAGRLRVLLAFVFGLVHGFGFAGVLAELELPTVRLVPALFGFNAGVELGQLGVVALVWPALRALKLVGEGRWHQLLTEVSSAAICGLGLFWFVTRVF